MIGPSGPVYTDFEMTSTGGQGMFRTDEMGMHEVLVKNEGEAVRGSPHFLRSMPKSKKDYDGIEPCAVGSTVEVLINPHHAARPELLEVCTDVSHGREKKCAICSDGMQTVCCPHWGTCGREWPSARRDRLHASLRSLPK